MYPKTYEDVFSSDENLKRFDVNQIKVRGFESQPEYIEFARENLRQMLGDYWMIVVKSSWLFFKFTYKGVRRNKMYANNNVMDMAFAVFHRAYVGIDTRVITRSSNLFNKLVDYFPDFYKDFDDRDPFKEPEYFKFPYNNISIDFLIAVYQMPERIELLDYAEKEKMGYSQFMDFLVNYTMSYNEEANEDVYILNMGDDDIPYIIYNKFSKNTRRKGLMKKKHD